MKPLVKTRTFWSGAGSIVTGIGLIIIGNKPEGLQLIFTGLGMVFLRSAINKNNRVGL
jgi:hypothetical protein